MVGVLRSFANRQTVSPYFEGKAMGEDTIKELVGYPENSVLSVDPLVDDVKPPGVAPTDKGNLATMLLSAAAAPLTLMRSSVDEWVSHAGLDKVRGRVGR